MTEAHEQTVTIVEHDLIGAHAERSESAEFRKHKAILVHNHPGCWMGNEACDTANPIEAHHLIEWCEWEKTDPEKLRAYLEAVDPYGYSKAMKGEPITSPDDIRNLILQCARCHRGVGLGAHHLSWPTWGARKVRRAGEAITVEEQGIEVKA